MFHHRPAKCWKPEDTSICRQNRPTTKHAAPTYHQFNPVFHAERSLLRKVSPSHGRHVFSQNIYCRAHCSIHSFLSHLFFSSFLTLYKYTYVYMTFLTYVCFIINVYDMYHLFIFIVWWERCTVVPFSSELRWSCVPRFLTDWVLLRAVSEILHFVDFPFDPRVV